MSTWTPVSQLCACWALPASQGKFEREAAELQENSAQAMKEQGDTLLRQGNFEGAVNAYDRALDLDGSLTPVLGNRALCKLKLKQYRCTRHCRHTRPRRAAKLSKAVCKWLHGWSAGSVASLSRQLHPHLAPRHCLTIRVAARVKLMQHCMVVKAAALPLLHFVMVPAACKCYKDRA